MARQPWRQYEIEILQNNQDLTAEQIQKLLPHRGISAIYSKRRETGTGSGSTPVVYSKEEEEFIRGNHHLSLLDLQSALVKLGYPKRGTKGLNAKRWALGVWRTGRAAPRPKCIVCGKDCKLLNAKFCSRKCRLIHERRPNQTCPTCGKRFYTNNHSKSYCSASCRLKNRQSTLDHTSCLLDETMLEVLDGHMLGDGNIEKPRLDGSPAARMNIKQKEGEFAKWVASFFPRCGLKIREIHRYDKRNGNTYHAWSGRTLHHPDFRKQYDRWYPDGKKVIPADVRLTPLSVLVWYLGDGSLDDGSGYPRIGLYTQSFERRNIESTLLPFLDDLCPDCFSLSKRNNIRSKKSSNGLEDFFDFIGERSPVACYDYKFLTIDELKHRRAECEQSKFRNLDLGRKKRLQITAEQIVSLRDKGLTSKEIAKKLGCGATSIKRLTPEEYDIKIREFMSETYEEIVALRRSGMSYRAIAEKVGGITLSGVHNVCKRHMNSVELEEASTEGRRTRRSDRMRACKSCGLVRKHCAHGLCQSCYGKSQRSDRSGHKPCTECGQVKLIVSKGRCDSCRRSKKKLHIPEFS